MTAAFTTFGLERDATITLDANGEGVATIVNNNAAALWIVRQISIITQPTKAGATCTVRKLPVGFVDTSYFAGTGDTAGDEPLYLRGGQTIELTWAGGPANGQGVCTFYYDEVIQ